MVLSDYGCVDGDPDYQSVVLHTYNKKKHFHTACPAISPKKSSYSDLNLWVYVIYRERNEVTQYYLDRNRSKGFILSTNKPANIRVFRSVCVATWLLGSL